MKFINPLEKCINLALSTSLIKIAILALYAFVCAIWFARTGDVPRIPQGDAWYYTVLAEKIRSFGFLPDLGAVRTYGYPLLLAAISLFSGVKLPLLVVCTGILQVIAFAMSTYWLSHVVSDRPYWSIAILAGLLLNPLIIDVITDTLTEGIIVTIFVLMISTLISALRSIGSLTMRWLLLGSILSALAFVVRPAAINLIIGWNMAAALLIMLRSHHWHLAIKRILIYYVLSSAIIIAILAPQIYHNFMYYNKITPFPTADLGNVQLLYGIRLWKYATLVKDSAAIPLNYVNPYFSEWPLGEINAFKWYVENPISALITILAHLFNAFNYDFINVYIYNLNFPSIALSVVLWILQTVGAIEVGIILKDYFKSDNRNLITTILTAFFVIVFAQLLAILALSGVENRFALLPTAFLIVFSCHAFLNSKQWSKYRIINTFLLCSLFAILGAMGTIYMKTLMTTDLISWS